MNTDESLFLLAAEELSFTKAAKKAYVTQQCLSAHIKKLEKKYQAQLFNRTSPLSLTPSGKILYQSLRKIQIIENSTRETLSGIREGTRGTVTIGMSSSRVQLLLPILYNSYHKEFPNVTIAVVIDDVRYQVQNLLNGKIDFLIGVNCPTDRNLNYMPIEEEQVYFLATDQLLEKYAATQGAYPHTLRTRIIDLSEFHPLPLISNSKGSMIAELVMRYFNRYAVIYNPEVRVSDADAQIRLVATGLVGVFIGAYHLPIVQECNALHPDWPPIRVYKPKNMTETLRYEIVTHRHAEHPLYIKRLIELCREISLQQAAQRMAP
jgi:DNA-binding transcriptional LysR family regulator